MSIKAVLIFTTDTYADSEEALFAIQEWQDTGDVSHITDLILDLEEIEVEVV